MHVCTQAVGPSATACSAGEGPPWRPLARRPPQASVPPGSGGPKPGARNSRPGSPAPRYRPGLSAGAGTDLWAWWPARCRRCNSTFDRLTGWPGGDGNQGLPCCFQRFDGAGRFGRWIQGRQQLAEGGGGLHGHGVPRRAQGCLESGVAPPLAVDHVGDAGRAGTEGRLGHPEGPGRKAVAADPPAGGRATGGGSAKRPMAAGGPRRHAPNTWAP